MKKFGGYEESKKKAEYKGSSQIPTGAYVAKVLHVKYEEGEYGDRITLNFDIAEGEQKDFFKKQYDANTDENKKWKGKVMIRVPADDGSEQDGWKKDRFARWIHALEMSNPGYAWDWDEQKWKGKEIGLVFGQTGTVIDGKEVVFTEVHSPCTSTEAREGTFYKKALELVKRNGYTGNGNTTAPTSSASSESFIAIPDGVDEEVPFNFD